MKLDRSFYMRDDVVLIARELLGKYIFTRFEDGLTGGVITETEAYAGIIDRASHAYNNRRTSRTEVMFGPGRVSALLGIHYSHSGVDLLGDQIWLEDRGIVMADQDILAGPRVGIDYAGDDANLPYRFTINADKLNAWK